MSFVGYE